MRLKSARKTFWILLVGVSLITLIAFGGFAYLKAAEEGPLPTGLYFFLPPFIVIGVVLGFFGVRNLIRLKRYGDWELECPDEGGMLGQPLQVKLFPSRSVMPTGEMSCHLRCIHSFSSGTRPVGGGTNSSAGRSAQTTVWEHKWKLRTATVDPRLGVDLTLPLPENGQPTTEARRDGTGHRVVWQLDLEIPADGISHDPVFPIPVKGAGGTGEPGDILQGLPQALNEAADDRRG